MFDLAKLCIQAARQRRPAKKAARGTQTTSRGADSAATPLRGGLGFGALTACTGRRRKPHAPVDDGGGGGMGADIEDASQWIEEADEVGGSTDDANHNKLIQMVHRKQISSSVCQLCCRPRICGGA